MNRISGAIFSVDTSMLIDGKATVRSLTGSEIVVGGYFISVLGAPAFQLGNFTMGPYS